MIQYIQTLPAESDYKNSDDIYFYALSFEIYHVCFKMDEKLKQRILIRREFVKTQPTQYGVQILKWCKRGSTIMCSIGLHPTGPPGRQPLLDRVGARHIFIRLTSIVQHSKV